MLPNRLSERATRVLIELYSRFRTDSGPIPDYASLAGNLHLSINDIDEAATELSVLGYIKIAGTFGDQGNSSVLILDEGKFAATSIRDATLPSHGTEAPTFARRDRSVLTRFFLWVFDHVIVKVIAAVMVAILLVWLGLR